MASRCPSRRSAQAPRRPRAVSRGSERVSPRPSADASNAAVVGSEPLASRISSDKICAVSLQALSKSSSSSSTSSKAPFSNILVSALSCIASFAASKGRSCSAEQSISRRHCCKISWCRRSRSCTLCRWIRASPVCSSSESCCHQEGSCSAKVEPAFNLGRLCRAARAASSAAKRRRASSMAAVGLLLGLPGILCVGEPSSSAVPVMLVATTCSKAEFS
mmetsp:Transcript_63957/g.129926  ORF Transcript_63957/g.129926 Transcript_63957/m.129926 type:complete len:219 (-) Transcript_63957:201-857(-)